MNLDENKVAIRALEHDKELQKQAIREVAKEFIDGVYKEMGKSILRAVGILFVLGVLALTVKFGILDKLL